jgi:gliding motility-associated-like protein
VPDIVVCNGTLINPINFTVNPAGATVQWKNTNTSIGLAANGTGNIAGFTVQNNTGQIQNAVVTAKTTNGSCPGDSIKFSIQVLPSVKTTTTRAKTTVCSGEFIPAVIFSNNQTVLWQNTNPAIGLAASGSGDMSGFTAVNSTTAPIQATVTFNITQSASCSEQTIIYPIEVKPNPTLSPLQDIEVCSGSPVAVSFQTSPSASQVKWTNSNPGIGLKPLNGTGNIASFTTTNYGTQTSISSTITAFSNLNGCPSDTVDIDITVHPFPNVDLGPDILVTQDTTITLTPDSLTSDVVSFKWTPGDNLSCTDCREPQLTVTRPDPFAPFTDSLVYNLEVTTANGCTREDQIAILIRYIPCAKGNIFIPTVFTPNGDGINDLFYIQGTGYGKVKQFLIFDRWGNKVFEKNNFIINDKTAGWNGVYKNQLVKTPATYVYYLTVECVAGQPQVIKGTISVLK